MNNNVEVWLWILMVMGPYNPKSGEILALCDGDVVRAARLIRDGNCPILSESEKQNAERIRSKDVQKLLEVCRSNDIRIVTLDDEEYPLRLKAIHNPPVLLFVKGSLAGLNDELPLAVVGTRNPHEYSKRVGRMIISELAKLGTVIVSGCAVGLDAAAHRACLEQGGRTIAVLGCGLLVNYPAENAQLKKDILSTGGALISELPPYTRTFPAYFQHRNRIISGLCVGTLIIEASAYSGCLLTAEHTIEQGRDLFCVPPHDITDGRFAGVMPLLRDGAIPVFSYIDIVNEYIYGYLRGDSYEGILTGVNSGMKLRDEGETPKKKKKSPEKSEKPEPAEPAPEAKTLDESVFTSLDPAEAGILRIICSAPSDIDEVIEKSGMGHLDVTAALTDLEMFGYITRRMDGKYEKA